MIIDLIDQDMDWRQRFAALYMLKRFVSCSTRDDAVTILKPFMPLVQAAFRDRDSIRLRYEALFIFGLMLHRYPKLVPKLNKLRNLLDNINECRNESFDYINGLDNSEIREEDNWRLNFGLALHTLIRAAYKNASIQVSYIIKAISLFLNNNCLIF